MDKTRKYLKLNCEMCNKEYIQQERVHRIALWKNRCQDHRGLYKKKINNNKKNGICLDCKKKIYLPAVRCITCSNKFRANAKKYCAVCSILISLKAKKYCLKCWNKVQDKGKSKERTKFQNKKAWKNVRIKCFERDKYTCQICLIKNKEGLGRTVILEAHHVFLWKDDKENRLNIDNLITACYDCHKYIHRMVKVA